MNALGARGTWSGSRFAVWDVVLRSGQAGVISGTYFQAAGEREMMNRTWSGMYENEGEGENEDQDEDDENRDEEDEERGSDEKARWGLLLLLLQLF